MLRRRLRGGIGPALLHYWLLARLQAFEIPGRRACAHTHTHTVSLSLSHTHTHTTHARAQVVYFQLAEESVVSAKAGASPGSPKTVFHTSASSSFLSCTASSDSEPEVDVVAA